MDQPTRFVASLIAELARELDETISDKAAESDPLRREGYLEAEDALRHVIEVLEGVGDIVSADQAARALQAGLAGFQPAVRVQIVEQVIELLRENIIAPAAMEPTNDVWVVAVRFLQKQIPADQWPALRLAIVDNAQEFAAQNHFPFGMSIRNALRAAGYTEAALGVGSLDDIWVELLEAAVSK